MDFINCICNIILRHQVGHWCVVEQECSTIDCRTKFSIWTCNTNRQNVVRTITNTVVIGIWVKWVSSGISCIVVDSCIGFIDVIKTIAIIVHILNQCWVAVGIDSRNHGIWLAITVSIGISRWVEWEGVWTCYTVWVNGNWTITHTVTIGVRIGWVSAICSLINI